MHTIKNFSDVHDILNRYVPSNRAFRGAYTLERMKSLMDKLGNPQDKYRVVHIAGTSGKTSTSYFMAALLRASGKKVGLTVSPHIDEVNERVQINLEPIPEAKFYKQFSIFLDEVDSTGIKPTYFELLVAFAFWQFAQEKVDYAVIEVGLGGLLDGTNVISRADKVSVITDIGLDHTSVLGNSLASIAAQKAGIILPHCPVFSYEQDEEIMSVLREVSSQLKAELHEVWPLSPSELPKYLPLYQRRNWYLSLIVYDFISKRDGLPELNERQLKDTTEVHIPARMETMLVNGKTIIIDGAHNSQKMSALVGSIKHIYKDRDIAVICSLLQGRKARTVSTLEQLTSISNHIILTSFSTAQDLRKKSTPTTKLGSACSELGFDDWQIINEPELALEVLLARPEPVLLVTGSFYLLNHVRPLLIEKS